MSEKRKRLPSRRPSEVRKIKMSNGQSLYVTLGYDPMVPDVPKEVFYDRGFREGAELQFIANDTCIMISLLLQAGYTANDISKSLSKTTLETPAGFSTSRACDALPVRWGMQCPAGWQGQLARETANPTGEVSKHGSIVGLIVEQLQIAPSWMNEAAARTSINSDV